MKNLTLLLVLSLFSVNLIAENKADSLEIEEFKAEFEERLDQAITIGEIPMPIIIMVDTPQKSIPDRHLEMIEREMKVRRKLIVKKSIWSFIQIISAGIVISGLLILFLSYQKK